MFPSQGQELLFSCDGQQAEAFHLQVGNLHGDSFPPTSARLSSLLGFTIYFPVCDGNIPVFPAALWSRIIAAAQNMYCCPEHFSAMCYVKILRKGLSSRGTKPTKDRTRVFKCVTNASTVLAVGVERPWCGPHAASGSVKDDSLFPLAGGTALSLYEREAGPPFSKEEWGTALGFSGANCADGLGIASSSLHRKVAQPPRSGNANFRFRLAFTLCHSAGHAWYSHLTPLYHLSISMQFWGSCNHRSVRFMDVPGRVRWRRNLSDFRSRELSHVVSSSSRGLFFRLLLCPGKMALREWKRV